MVEGQQSRLSAGRAGDAGGGRLHAADLSRTGVGVRGVNVDGVMGPLLARGLIEEAGHDQRVRRRALRHHQLLLGTDGAEDAAGSTAACAAATRGGGTGGRAGTAGRGTDELGRRDRAGRPVGAEPAELRRRVGPGAASVTEPAEGVRLQKVLAQPGSPLAGHAKS